MFPPRERAHFSCSAIHSIPIWSLPPADISERSILGNQCAVQRRAFDPTGSLSRLGRIMALVHIPKRFDDPIFAVAWICLIFLEAVNVYSGHIIGSLLTVVDLSVMLKRAKDSFGVKVLDSKSKKTVGCGMLAVMLLEDLPQMGITIAYFVEIGGNDVREVDPIAITSLALSGVFFFVNVFFVVKYICC